MLPLHTLRVDETFLGQLAALASDWAPAASVCLTLARVRYGAPGGGKHMYDGESTRPGGCQAHVGASTGGRQGGA